MQPVEQIRHLLTISKIEFEELPLKFGEEEGKVFCLKDSTVVFMFTPRGFLYRVDCECAARFDID